MFLPVFQPRTAGRWVQCRVGALEASLSSQAWFRDGISSNLLLHFPPLLAGQEKVHMLGGDVLTEGVLLDTEIYRDLMLKQKKSLNK